MSSPAEHGGAPRAIHGATGQIVNNESSEIIVMLNGVFNEWAEHPGVDLYPAHLRAEIDALNEWVYSGLNNGVYRAGFASSQDAYDEAVGPVFETLDRMDALLAGRRYLAGSQHTLADWRAFPTLMRFDLVYHGLFRCNRRRLIDYDNVWPYLRDLYQTPRVAATVNFDHFIRGYNLNLPQLNPAGIIPLGPELDFMEPHGREAAAAEQSSGAAVTSWAQPSPAWPPPRLRPSAASRTR
jgi:glutathionyl-hydroquinone reductase